MKKTWLAVFLLFSIFSLSAQPQIDTGVQFNEDIYSCIIFKVDSSVLSNFLLYKNNGNLNHKDFIEQYIANHDSNFFAINACVNDNAGNPLGLFISDRKEINHLNTDDGAGNFFLKPNGILAFTKSSVEIIESTKFNSQSDVINAIQSGPMLVINDSIHSSFNQISTNKNLRCGVGIFKNKKSNYLVFAISKEPVTFFAFSSFFKEHFHCKNALCLESANSAIYLPGKLNNLATNKVVGNYIIYSPVDSIIKTATKKKNVIQMEKMSSGVYEIPVELNRVLKITFIFDPGASDVSISPDIAMTLIRTGTVSEKDFVGSQTYTFANGSTAVSNVFILHEIKIGDYVVKNVRASISNSIQAPILLGQSVMQRMGKFTVDNVNHTLTVE